MHLRPGELILSCTLALWLPMASATPQPAASLQCAAGRLSIDSQPLAPALQQPGRVVCQSPALLEAFNQAGASAALLGFYLQSLQQSPLDAADYPAVLNEMTRHYLALQEQLEHTRAATSAEPQLAALTAQAAAAVQDADFDLAVQRLDQALAISRQQPEWNEQAVRQGATLLASQGYVELTRLHYSKAAELLMQAGEQQADWPDSRTLQWLADAAEAWLKAGDDFKAEDAWRSYQSSVRRLMQTAQNDSQWQIALAISHRRIGDIYRQDDGAGAAVRAYMNALDILRQLMVTDPANTDWHAEFSLLQQRIDDLQAGQEQAASTRASIESEVDASGITGIEREMTVTMLLGEQLFGMEATAAPVHVTSERPRPADTLPPEREVMVNVTADKQVTLGGPRGSMLVRIGHELPEPADNGSVVSDTATIRKIGESAIISPQGDAVFEPASSGCIEMHEDGIEQRFLFAPKVAGEIIISTAIAMYRNNECQGAAIPRAVDPLTVTVISDEPGLLDKAGTSLVDAVLDLWKQILALVVATIIAILTFKSKAIIKRFSKGPGENSPPAEDKKA